ncbi:MAG TPA: type I methionyl aminopeptidase [Dehalococcoidia bacterium]|jgi:methionyl aminopeptidase|nr:type I methionyl aminopeptidase [Dehalococcoidia bacterium]
MPIILKSDDEIAIMREAGRIVAQTLQVLVDELRPGLVVKELDKIVRREFAKHDVIPTFLGYGHPAYPATVCVSVNEEIVHGIPGKRVIQEGDVVSLDLGCTYKGFVADSAVTVIVGKPKLPVAEKLVDVTRGALEAGIARAKAGAKLGEVSHAIQTHIESQGFGVVREYVGHGVGRQMHEEPQVPNFGPSDRGPVLKKGMVLALEPMVTVGDWRTRQLDDNWTVVTADGSLAAHFEHTIAITDNGAQVLTTV